MPTTALNYMGSVTSSTRQKVAEVLEAAEAAGHKITHIWGYDPNPGNEEHHSKRAADFMVFRNKDAGDFIAGYLYEHGERLGLIHEIWFQRIRSRVNEPGVWRDMADRGNSTENHLDHVHVWFDSSAYVANDGSKPKHKAPTKTVWGRGDEGEKVKEIQKIVGVAVDGVFGPNTENALERWQLARGLDADGLWGPQCEKAKASKPKVTAKPKPKPAKRVSSNSVRVPAFPGLTRRGSRGTAVRKVQQRLKDRGWKIDVDGIFGEDTETVVRAFQKEKRIAVDGVVGSTTWAVLWKAKVT